MTGDSKTVPPHSRRTNRQRRKAGDACCAKVQRHDSASSQGSEPPRSPGRSKAYKSGMSALAMITAQLLSGTGACQPLMAGRRLIAMNPVGRLRAEVGWRLFGGLSMARSVWRLRGWDRAQSIPIAIAIPDARRVPVIFCTWKRLERLPLTLELLAAQDVAVQALIWDNSRQPDVVGKAVADAR